MDSLPPGVDPSTVPLVSPPPGVTSNFVDPPSLSWAIRLSIYSTLPLVVPVIVLRVYVRLRNHQTGVDDYLLYVTAAAAVTICCLLLPLYLDDVYGRHYWDIPISLVRPDYAQYALALNTLYNISSMLVKVSILTLYLRLFHPSRYASLSIWSGIVCVVIAYIAFTCLSVFYLYNPPSDERSNTGQSIGMVSNPLKAVTFAQGIYNTFTDFYIVAIPAFVVTGLRLPLEKKVGVVVVFLTALLSCGCSTAGLFYRYQYTSDAAQDDKNWSGIIISALAIVEINIGIVCGCMPVIFVVFKELAARTESGFLRLKERRVNSHPGNIGKASHTRIEEYPSEQLPQPPRRALIGLMSHIRKGDLLWRSRNIGTDDSMHVYIELRSIDYGQGIQVQGRKYTERGINW